MAPQQGSFNMDLSAAAQAAENRLRCAGDHGVPLVQLEVVLVVRVPSYYELR